jgi:uncharacterized membrane protein YhaH (DUF805 family)/acetyltransferase-like isoleucine patch superfamily enzyme
VETALTFVVLMPSFVNLGAYVDEGTMVDTWATVGSCAQIGKNVHLSGGVGIGGVLEPLQAGPVIIEDNCFIGARSEVVEGCIVREGAVLGMGVYIGKSTKIVDRATGEVMYGEVPAYSVLRGDRQNSRRADPVEDRINELLQGLRTADGAAPGSGMRWLLFSVSGRLSRKTYALTMLFWAVLSIPVSAAVKADPDSGAMAMAGFGFIWSFLLAAWSIAVTSIKRLHDAGLPGILVGVLVIPAASFLHAADHHALAVGEGPQQAWPRHRISPAIEGGLFAQASQSTVPGQSSNHEA